MMFRGRNYTFNLKSNIYSSNQTPYTKPESHKQTKMPPPMWFRGRNHTSNYNMNLKSRVKIEPGLKTIYELNDNSDGDVEVLRSESKI